MPFKKEQCNKPGGVLQQIAEDQLELHIQQEELRKILMGGMYRGEYDPNLKYDIGETVSLNGTVYQSKIENNPDTPPSNNWRTINEINVYTGDNNPPEAGAVEYGKTLINLTNGRTYTAEGDGTVKYIGGAIDVATVEALEALDGIHKTAILKDKHRGGTFIYDASKSNMNDGGAIFNGWVRQHDGRINATWFLSNLLDKNTVVNELNAMFANTSYYTYYISHEVNYGSDIAHNGTIFTKLNIPNRDFIVIDDSIDNGYSDVDHQGGQARVCLVSKDANVGQHNSFLYVTSQHHPGCMYNIAGNGIDNTTGKLARNSTIFFHSLKTNYLWGIGMGGNTIPVSDKNNGTEEEELTASGFKIVVSGLRGSLGLSNVHNISLKTGNVGWFSGTEPAFKYQFGFSNLDNNKNFVLKSTDSAYPSTLFISSTGYWENKYTDNNWKIASPMGERFFFSKDGNFKSVLGISGSTTTTANRPDASLCKNGTMMFDTDLGKPIWLPNNTSNTWVDANGNVV